MKILLFCAVILVSIKSIAQSQSWMGYLPATSLNFPFQDFIENSVYRMTTIGMVDDPSIQPKIINLNDPRYNRATTDIYKLENDNETLAIETCRKQGLTQCPVVPAVTMTAFFNKSGLHTCRHGFHNWLLWAAQLNGRSANTISPPVRLFDRSGKIVYNSANIEKNSLLRFSEIDKNPKLEFVIAPGYEQSGGINFRNSDYVEMISEAALFTDYKLKTVASRNDIEWGQQVFMFGYPVATNYRGNVVKNTPGSMLVGTTGKIGSFPAESAGFDSNHLGLDGSSGSPVLSQQGTILGVSCQGAEVVLGPDEVVGSVNVLLLNKAFLKKFWARQQ